MFILAHNGASALGGGEISVALLLAGLQRRGHRVLLLCRDETIAGRLADYGISTDVQRVGGDAMLPDALRFAARVRREQPDVVFLTTFKKMFLASLGARLGGARYVVQRVGLESDTPRATRYRVALRRWVDRAVLNADSMRPAFLAGDPRLPEARVVTILDGVPVPVRTAAPGTLRRELGIPADAVVVGAAARLARQKRFDRLVRALALLPANVHCVLAGAGDERDALAALAAELGVQDRLHLLGFRGDVGNVLDALDVFVVSSDREGLANAMLEAMALGLPVVSTEVSGAREALDPRPGEPAPGIVVPRDEGALAEAIGRLAGDADARRAMGEAALARA